MLAYDPCLRISAREALEHPFLRDAAHPGGLLEEALQADFQRGLVEKRSVGGAGGRNSSNNCSVPLLNMNGI